MNNPSTKLWLCFLLNVLSVFDRFNAFFQTSTYTAHNLYGESVRLLKTVLSFFVKPQVIREHHNDLTKLPYHNNSTHLANNDTFIGDSTIALFVHASDNEDKIFDDFYHAVVMFYQCFIQKQLKRFDFKSQLLLIINPQGRVFLMKLIVLHLDKSAVKLKLCEFQVYL